MATREQKARIVSVGEKFLGTDYLLGSTDIFDTTNIDMLLTTFDCSDFTQFVFATSVGVILPRTSNRQATEGTAIAFNNMETGDLFFSPRPSEQQDVVGHVGIFVEPEFLLHTFDDRGVIWTRINSFWRNAFITARRVV